VIKRLEANPDILTVHFSVLWDRASVDPLSAPRTESARHSSHQREEDPAVQFAYLLNN
jgi:hypothetical protein